MDTGRILKIIEVVAPEIIRLRHELHKYPEIACKEYKTSDIIKNFLIKQDVKILPPLLETDVVSMLNEHKKGKNVTLRADMDALPINEENIIPYHSRHEGMMHACGHDGHTAILLGAAYVLNKIKDMLQGSVRFVFQPGEEMLAAGKELVEKGVLKNPSPDMVIALHGCPGLKEGSIASKHNVIYAAATHFKLTIKGKGGHGSTPEYTIDPIVIASQIVNALQTVVSRNISTLKPVVISVCKFHAGTSANIIPERVDIEGTTRYINPELKDIIPDSMEKIIKGICDSYGAEYIFEYKIPYIPTVNTPKIVDFCKKVTEKWLGENQWHTFEQPFMGGEDFSYFLTDNPGAMFNIGLGENSNKLHTPDFNFNDNVIKNGITFFVASTLEFLNGKEGVDNEK